MSPRLGTDRDAVQDGYGRLFAVVAVVLGGLAAHRLFEHALYAIYKEPFGGDFWAFYSAAQRVLNGRTLYPELPLPGEPGTYIYPPTLALVLTPLAGLPSKQAYLIFIVVALAAVAASVVLLSHFAPVARWGVAATLGVVALAAWPLHLLMRQGQSDSLTLVLMVAALNLQWRNRTTLAALALGTAITIKVTPGVLVVYFLWKRRYAFAAKTVLTTLALLVVGGLLTGPTDLVRYVDRVLLQIGSVGDAYWYNQSLHALFHRLFAENNYTTPVANLGLPTVTLLAGLTTLALLVVTLALVPRTWSSSAGVLLVEAGAFMALEILGSSRSYQMHAVWLLVPIAGLLVLALEVRRVPRWYLPAVSIAALAFLAGPYGPPVEYGRFHTGWLTILNAHTTAATLLILILCLYLSHRYARQLRTGEVGAKVIPSPVVQPPGVQRPVQMI